MTRGNAAASVVRFNFGKAALRVWTWIGILTLILWAYPVAYRTTRLLLILGFTSFWAGALLLWWRKKIVTIPLLSLAFLFFIVVFLPGRPVRSESLAQDYCRGLRWFRGVRYVWGGEGMLGIDCSGLVRQGLIWGQFRHGLRTMNGQPIRDALWLWWNDCSAMGLRDGFNGLTRKVFSAESILEAEPGKLQPGDLAVTADGVHVMTYLGNRTWIEADPDAHKVLEVTLPTNNPWFRAPVVFMRWRWLDRN